MQRERNSSNRGVDDFFNRDENSKGAGSNVGSTDAINRLGMDNNLEFGFDIDVGSIHLSWLISRDPILTILGILTREQAGINLMHSRKTSNYLP